MPASLRLVLAVALSILGLASVAGAETRPVVVELFTSQGCSSCPPADALMHELVERDDVIALSLHVDYWDYIGWKDSFADAAFTDRQRKYAVEGGRRSVYTPQMIVNGETALVGARSMKLAEAIEAHKNRPVPFDFDAARVSGVIRVTAEPFASGAPLVVHMVRIHPSRSVDILRGENAGRSVTYVNVAEDWRVVGEWSGTEPLDLEVPLEGDLPAVVLIQERGYGLIHAAAILR